MTFPAGTAVWGYKDITPRVGVAYDLFGNGRTALKFNFGHYVSAASNDPPYQNNNPTAALTNTTPARSWTDNNNNLLVDCDIANGAAQGPRAGRSCCRQLRRGQIWGTTRHLRRAVDHGDRPIDARRMERAAKRLPGGARDPAAGRPAACRSRSRGGAGPEQLHLHGQSEHPELHHRRQRQHHDAGIHAVPPSPRRSTARSSMGFTTSTATPSRTTASSSAPPSIPGLYPVPGRRHQRLRAHAERSDRAGRHADRQADRRTRAGRIPTIRERCAAATPSNPG